MGALPQLYAATGADVESGQFYGPDGRGESKGFPTLVEPLDDARDRELGKRLWDISEELTGVRIPLASSTVSCLVFVGWSYRATTSRTRNTTASTATTTICNHMPCLR